MSTNIYEPIKVAEPDSPEWYSSRMSGIGASEAADALGLSDYGEQYKLFHKKIGNIPEDDENDLMWFGKEVESLVVKFWERKTGKKVLEHPCGMYRHPVHKFILATPDAIIDDKTGLELKSMDWRIAKEMGEQGSDFIPDGYVIQAQQQMLVMGWEQVDFAIMVERDLKQFTVHREESLIDVLISGLSEMWERIQTFDEPEPDWENNSVPDTMKKVFRTINPETTMELSQASSDDWSQYEALGIEERKIKKEREKLKAKVMREIGNRSAAILPGGSRMIRRKKVSGCNYTTKRSDRIDMRAVNMPKE